MMIKREKGDMLAMAKASIMPIKYIEKVQYPM